MPVDFLRAAVPFGLHPDEWGLAVFLGLALLGLAWGLGWFDRVPGVVDLLGGPSGRDRDRPGR